MIRLVYVAGPYSAATRAGVEANIARATQLGLLVAKLGAMPVIPHANTAHEHFEQCQPYEWWIEATLELMRRCDAVILTDDWKRSSGACGELQEARRLSMPVFYDTESLRSWLEAQS